MEGWESMDWSNPARKVASGGFCKHGNKRYRFRKDPNKRFAPLVIICFLCVGIIPLHYLVLCGLYLVFCLKPFFGLVGW